MDVDVDVSGVFEEGCCCCCCCKGESSVTEEVRLWKVAVLLQLPSGLVRMS